MKKTWLLSLPFLAIAGMTQAQDMKPEDTEVWEPVPQVVTPGKGTKPPSDAIVLFDGSGFDEWESTKGGEVKWKLEGDAMVIVPGTGDIRTKREFTDYQLHIEWRTPSKVVGEGQGRGNSGIFMQGRYELQVLDSYNNKTYSNGQAGSIYKDGIPLVNASLPPGEWQTYDVIYTAPRFNEDGSVKSKARITVLHNGVLIQNNFEIAGLTLFVGEHHYEEGGHGPGPIILQDHTNPNAFRNIWIREL